MLNTGSLCLLCISLPQESLPSISKPLLIIDSCLPSLDKRSSALSYTIRAPFCRFGAPKLSRLATLGALQCWFTISHLCILPLQHSCCLSFFVSVVVVVPLVSCYCCCWASTSHAWKMNALTVLMIKMAINAVQN